MKTERLVDSYGRTIRSLRISVTEICNFRCVYCSSADIGLVPPSNYLTRHEIERVTRIACGLGITKVRLTGGEPLMRPDLTEIVRSLKSVEGLEELAITTNASRLAPKLAELKAAGLDRINISLDSMDPERFKEITLVDACREVMSNVSAALEHGFPVKVNVVALKGLRREEIISFVRLAFERPLEIRFLEFMPLCGEAWKPELFLPIAEVRSLVHEHFDLEELPRHDAPAQSFRIRGGAGRVGFIASLTESFCGSCSRIRLTSDGKIRPCLFSNTEVPLKDLLRSGAPDEKIADAIRLAAWIKPEGNHFHAKPFSPEETAVRGAGPAIRKIGG